MFKTWDKITQKAYRQQLEVLSVYRIRRTAKLAVDFDESGNSINTHLVIIPALRVPLDIRRTVKITNGIKSLELSQGRNFQFSEGMVLYDDIAAYTKPWGEALSVINQAVQIKDASNAFYISKLKYNMMLTGNEDEDDKIEPVIDMRALNLVDIGKYYYNPGYVKFTLFKTDLFYKKLIPDSTLECTQWDFVKYILTGHLTTLEQRKTTVW